MKIFRWFSDNILFVFTLFLLAFVPLYPKLPFLDVKNTWVYVRAEDFVVVFVLLIWIFLIIRKKISLRTPLTMPILLFWIIGGLATVHGILLIFPETANVFPNVAFLSFLRRIEYISLFFISYSGMKDKRFLSYVILTLVTTLFLVSAYGFGQKYLGFPAYLTMNEEFAKGEAIRLSALSRVPSTFAGHYDLAAYLVLVIPILVSLIFGFRNWIVRAILMVSISFGLILLFMTVSRVSFFVLLISLGLVLFFQKKKLVIFSLPIVAILFFVFLSFTPALLERFGNTIKEVDVLVDASNGEVIGHTKVVPAAYFENKLVLQRTFQNRNTLDASTDTRSDRILATYSAILPFEKIPPSVVLIVPPNAPTGENLPQGTGYINLHLSPVTKRLKNFFYESKQTSETGKAFVFQGNFLIKRASAYDLSFTTRFQGEWPNAIKAFKRNILFGSGYGSISLAIDNNYLRILGEVGLFGFAAFLVIFISVGVYIQKILPHVESPVARSFVLGFTAGVVGLALNALFIDVFEASKVAFLLWLLTGVTLGVLHFYQTTPINLSKELKKVFTSQIAIIIYLCLAAVVVFSPMVRDYFVGDDFTWFRWAADCGKEHCPSAMTTIFHYFTEADGFFYRPGTKTYFYLMYSLFWLNQMVYHVVSLSVHIVVVVLFFLLAKKVLRDSMLAALAAFLFLITSGYAEIVFWVSATGHVFNAMFILLSLLSYIWWEEKRRILFIYLSLVFMSLSLLFHELGIIVPFLILLYKFTQDESFTLSNIFRKSYSMLLFLPILPYLAIRFVAQSHWFSGDYNYNLLKFPVNAIGNMIGYFFLTLFGPLSLSFYQTLRATFKEQVLISIVVSIILAVVFIFIYRIGIGRMKKEEKKIVLFGVLFFIISLLPFLGLGNITSRYSYLSSMGVIIVLVYLIKKSYLYLIGNGREIAIGSLVVVLGLFSLFHMIQVQQIHSDWYEAGKKSQNFFIAIDESYRDYWAKEPMTFHFVNVPLRVGEAWVFPVGLADALWLTFRNPDTQVYTWQTTQEALSAAAQGSKNEKVFLFDESGRVKLHEKTKDIRDLQ